MTRVLLIGDVHLLDRAPASVVGTYTDDIFDMLDYIAKMEVEGDYDAVIQAGDLYHFKNPSRTSHALVLRSIEAFRKFRNPYIVVGNHDVSNDVLETVSEKQPLGVLLASGAVKELNGWHPDLPICGVPWQSRWLQPGSVQEAFSEWRNGSRLLRSLCVTHAPIIPPALDSQMFETLNVDEVADAMENDGYLYYGHIHEDHGVWEHGGITFANVGALSRGSLHEYNIERRIQVCEWDSGKGFTPIEIPHKAASEVFHIQEKVEQVSQKVSLDTFLSGIGATTLDISDTGSVIEHIRTMDIHSRVKAKAIALLEEAQ